MSIVRMAAVAVALIVWCGVADSAAQTPNRQFGFKLGPTFSTLSVDPEEEDDDTGRRITVGGGAFVLVPLGSNVGLQFEGLFAPKGRKIRGEEGTEFEGLEGQIALDYLEFPVLLRLDGPRSPARSFHVFGGASAGYNLAARTELVVQGDVFDNGVSENIRRDIKKLELGLVAGAGMEFGRFVVVDARYVWGLTNVSALDDDETVVKNRAFTILAGIRFHR